jgi:hypothetical protein
VKTERSNAFQLDFIESLATKPYCTDELGVTHIRPKSTAVKRKYLQVNRPSMVTYLVFDIDREGAVLSWYDEGLPAPYWTSKNPLNAHGHIAYRLKVPFCTSDIAHVEPIRYAAAIESAMIQRLKADPSFAGLLTKNPLNPNWQNQVWTEHEYTLDELADYLDLRGHPLSGAQATGIGRNCELFDSVRNWAYRAIRDYWAPNYKREWNRAVLERVELQNGQFIEPLPFSEVKAIAKSISNWTYREFTPAKFRASQAKKGAKGGKVSKGGGRPSLNEPWLELGISRATYFRKKKAGTL